MIWILLVILIIVVIVAVSRGSKKSKLEVEKLQNEKLSVSDELAKLKKLLDEGTISQEEFEAQKQRILNS